ncbi:MAG: T9SS type A sorting domain-containing protein [Saprospiraceae bacterium]|nr:T9SS type A sorting domain-containing protein [Saprospiraceae bacterium]
MKAKIKLSISLFFAVFFTISVFSQVSVIVVDDSSDNFDNTKELTSVLDSLGVEYFYFDAEQSGTPDITIMNAFDIVLWHTSTWGTDLLFWDNKDEDSQLLKAYLNQPNANLWLIGNDFMFDRYGAAPDDFGAGTFPYDYLGIKKYVAQSYGDDGNKGVPFVAPATTNPIAGLKDISWSFATLWWADNYEIRDEAKPVYIFGGNDYPLRGGITGLYYPRTNGSKVLTFGFDLSLAADFSIKKQTINTVLSWWNETLSGIENPKPAKPEWGIYPTLVNADLTITSEETFVQPIIVELISMDGIPIFTIQQNTIGLNAVNINLSAANLKSGTYLCRISTSDQVFVKRIIKL